MSRKKTDVRLLPQFGLLECGSASADIVQERECLETGSVHDIGEVIRPAIPEADNGNRSELFERIAQTLPPEQREEYWREMVHLKHLDPDDELLRLARATGYLTQITQSVPTLIAEERQRFEKLLNESVAAIERTHQATQTYHRDLDQRLSKLPETIAGSVQPIAAGLNSDALTKAIIEKVQQQLAGLDDTSQLLHSVSKQLKEVSGELDRAVKPPQKRYSSLGVSIEGELLKLDHASARLREHSTRLMAQTHGDRWFWKALGCLVLFAAGLLAGIAWEKRNTTSMIFDLQGQIAQLQQTIKAPPSTAASNPLLPRMACRKKGGVVAAK